MWPVGDTEAVGALRGQDPSCANPSPMLTPGPVTTLNLALATIKGESLSDAQAPDPLVTTDAARWLCTRRAAPQGVFHSHLHPALSWDLLTGSTVPWPGVLV